MHELLCKKNRDHQKFICEDLQLIPRDIYEIYFYNNVMEQPLLQIVATIKKQMTKIF